MIIEPVNECKTVLVESSVVDNHASETCPLDQVRKSNKEGDLLETCSAELADGSEQCNDLQGVGSCEENSELDPDSGRCWELEQGDPQTSDVQGRLHVNVTFWEQVLEAPPQIIDCIKEGYKLPLLSLPEPYSKPNHKSALQNKEFVSQAISDLIKSRCVVKIEDIPPICSPLSVIVNNSGKKRLVIDLRHLNQYLLKDNFKYEDLRTAMLLFQKDDYLFSFDLKSGYHHVDIHSQHQKYLGFVWDMGYGLQHYMFKVLPFGLAPACYIFTKLLRPLVKYWRSQGLRAIVYLDDGVIAVSGKEAAQKASHSVRADLVKAGFVEHSAKCTWEPTQRLCWLGFNLDLKIGFISVPLNKIQALKALLEHASKQEMLTARQLASITGKIISMSLALGTIARLQTRSLYALINTRESWCQKLKLSPETKTELRFWKEKLDNFNGQNIWHSASAVRLVYSDASDTGYGGYTVEHGCHIAQGQWLPHESARSSTWRELKAVHRVLESLANKLSNQRIRWFSDNQKVVRILSVGSRNPVLQNEALAIFNASVTHQVRIEPEWIPREVNQQADFISRIIDHDDWSIHPAIFQRLDVMWGPHTIDQFASYFNTQLPRFNSRFWNPGSEAVDAFTCDWQGENNWWCPPVYLVPRVLRHAQATKATGTLLVPNWPSATFWPMLFTTNTESELPASVKATLVIDKSEVVICPGRSGASLFKELPNTDMLALRLEF